MLQLRAWLPFVFRELSSAEPKTQKLFRSKKETWLWSQSKKAWTLKIQRHVSQWIPKKRTYQEKTEKNRKGKGKGRKIKEKRKKKERKKRKDEKDKANKKKRHKEKRRARPFVVIFSARYFSSMGDIEVLPSKISQNKEPLQITTRCINKQIGKQTNKQWVTNS